MATIKLTQGKVTTVPDELFEQLTSMGSWYARRDRTAFYAARMLCLPNGKRRLLLIHNVIWNLLHGEIPYGYTVDHHDHDGLHNSAENLRLANRRQQGQNRSRQKNNKSGLIGVSWHKDNQKFRADVKVEQKQIFLGYHDSKFDAAMVRDAFVRDEFGEFAVLNFPGLRDVKNQIECYQ